MIKAHTKTRYHDRFVYYSNDLFIGGSINEYGEYAQVEVDFLLNCINQLGKNPAVVYDIGSNIGYHTTAFASLNSQVHAYEPNPLNFALLKQNVRGLKNVVLHNCAVSNQNGTTTIGTYNPKEPGNFGDVHINAKQGIDITTVRLDDENLPAPDLIKVDVEGYEYGVLLGAEQILMQHQPIVYYEVQDMRDFDRIWFYMTRIGYRLYWSIVPNYNPNNFNHNSNNIFGNSVIFSMVALPNRFGVLEGAFPVTGPDDHWNRFTKK